MRYLYKIYKEPSERDDHVRDLLSVIYLSYPGLLFVVSSILLDWRSEDSWGFYKMVGCLISIGMMVITAIFAIYIVRLKKFKVKCPEWINEQIKVYEEDKKARDEQRAKLEKLKKSKSIYTVGENFYTEKKEDEEKGSESRFQKQRTLQMCGICFSVPSDCLFKPCNHGGICQGCAKKVFEKKKACPFCREKVTKLVVYKQLDFDGDDKIDKYAVIQETELKT